MIVLYNAIWNKHIIIEDGSNFNKDDIPVLRTESKEVAEELVAKLNKGLNRRCFRCHQIENPTFKTDVYFNSVGQYMCKDCFISTVAPYKEYMKQEVHQQTLREIMLKYNLKKVNHGYIGV